MSCIVSWIIGVVALPYVFGMGRYLPIVVETLRFKDGQIEVIRTVEGVTANQPEVISPDFLCFEGFGFVQITTPSNFESGKFLVEVQPGGFFRHSGGTVERIEDAYVQIVMRKDGYKICHESLEFTSSHPFGNIILGFKDGNFCMESYNINHYEALNQKNELNKLKEQMACEQDVDKIAKISEDILKKENQILTKKPLSSLSEAYNGETFSPVYLTKLNVPGDATGPSTTGGRIQGFSVGFTVSYVDVTVRKIKELKIALTHEEVSSSEKSLHSIVAEMQNQASEKTGTPAHEFLVKYTMTFSFKP